MMLYVIGQWNTWVLSAPDEPHVDPMNFALRVVFMPGFRCPKAISSMKWYWQHTMFMSSTTKDFCNLCYLDVAKCNYDKYTNKQIMEINRWDRKTRHNVCIYVLYETTFLLWPTLPNRHRDIEVSSVHLLFHVCLKAQHCIIVKIMEFQLWSIHWYRYWQMQDADHTTS